MILKMQTVSDEGWAYIDGISRCRVLRCVVAEPDAMGEHGGPVLLYPECCDGNNPSEEPILTRANVNWALSEFDMDLAKRDLKIEAARQTRDGNTIHAYMVQFWRKGDDPDMGPATVVLCNTRLFLTDDQGQTIDRYTRHIPAE